MTAGPAARRWVAARVAHPTGDLDRSAAFYRDLLGLQPRGGFADHDGYDGIFFALPGGGELELTAGPAKPRPGTDEDLLVLYLPTLDDVRQTAAELEAAGVPTVPAANPYWDRWGRVFLDPDGYAVVVAATQPDPVAAGEVRVQTYDGLREDLRGLFELAEDSAAALDSYLHAGRVLVAVVGSDVVGHLQLVETDRPGQAEIMNMAVREDVQGRGVGALLVRAAVDRLAAEAGATLLVATAAADVGNVRFFQRQGFRMRSIERDAFTPTAGYPPGTRIDGIELRDRVWLDRPIGPPTPGHGRQ
ncbi:GNAT family N-acetyltransferase [Oryzihumus leptocrescens]|uniref:GNAT family N-acetyltransferase n=1 Tax=Oryzihumus leptocrescens TaxID=297536 RepID=UPI001C89CA0F|nr:GNAT family N-acetyltransferase [Oryzihumus leptocrescens]